MHRVRHARQFTICSSIVDSAGSNMLPGGNARLTLVARIASLDSPRSARDCGDKWLIESRWKPEVEAVAAA
jgi:hypothetical protein